MTIVLPTPLPPPVQPASPTHPILALTYGRLNDLQSPMTRDLDKAARRLADTKAAVRLALEHRTERAELLTEAGERYDVAKQRLATSHQLGHPGDEGRAGLSNLAYAAIVAGAAFIEYNIDKGALEVLRLSDEVTNYLAFGFIGVSVAAAHVAGHTFRRTADVIDPSSLGRAEVWIGRAAFGLGIGLALAIAGLRAWYTNSPLAFAVFAVVSLLLFLVMTWAAHRHTNDALRGERQAMRVRWWHQRRFEDAERQIEKKRAKYHACHRRLMGTASRWVGRAERIKVAGESRYAQSHPDQPPVRVPDPLWVAHLRAVAAGHLPPQLQLDEGDLR